MKRDQRHAAILAAAMKLAREHGYKSITRDSIASAAGCATGLVSHYFGTMPQLQRAIMGEAIRLEDLEIIAQGLSAKDRRAMGLDESLKRRALESLLCN